MVYEFFDKKTAGRRGINMNANNEKLTEESHKPIIKKFKKRTVYSRFKDNIWVADLADMQLISKFNKRFRLLLCVIDIFSKYAWVVPLKDKKAVTITNTIQRILNDQPEGRASPKDINQTKYDKGSDFTIAPLKNG